MIHDPECGPIGVVYEATSAKGSPALIGFVSASRGLVSKETDVNTKKIIYCICNSLPMMLKKKKMMPILKFLIFSKYNGITKFLLIYLQAINNL